MRFALTTVALLIPVVLIAVSLALLAIAPAGHANVTRCAKQTKPTTAPCSPIRY